MDAPMEKYDEKTLSTLLKALNVLITPAALSTPLKEDDSEQLLDTVLSNNFESFIKLFTDCQILQKELRIYSHSLLQNTKQSFLESSIVSVRQKFVEVCICLLHCIKNNLLIALHETNEPLCDQSHKPSEVSITPERRQDLDEAVPQLQPDALSIQQEKLVSATVQFIVVLGLTPYLTSGVGIPVSQRLGPGQILLATAHDYSTQLRDLDRIKYLLPVAKLFSEMLDVPSLKDILLNNYLADLLAAHIQIRYCSKSVMSVAKQQKHTEVASCQIPLKNNEQELVTTHRTGSSCPEKDSYIVQEISAQPTSVSSNQLPVTETSKRPVSFIMKSSERIYPMEDVPDMYLDSKGQPWTLQSVIEYCNKEIDHTIRCAGVQLVLTVLLTLSGGVKSKNSSTLKSPIWFRRTIANILRDVIMVPPAVQHLMTLFIGDSPGEKTQDWQKCKALAQIISHCPVTPNNLRQFYISISQQLIEFIQASNTKVSPLILRAVGATILELDNQQPDLMGELCLMKVLTPLRELYVNSENRPCCSEGDIVLAEEAVTSCIICLHRLFVLSQEPHSPLLRNLRSVLGVLFSIFSVARSGVSPLKSPCKDLIKAYLAYCSTSEAVACLMTLATSCHESPCFYSPLLSDFCIQSGPQGGLQAVYVKDRQLNLDTWNQPVDAIVDLLSVLTSDAVTSDLFLCLLQKLTDIVTTETADMDIVLPPRVLSSAEKATKMTELRRKITLISLLASVGEKFGEQVLCSCQHVLIFAKATLERCVKVFTFSSEHATIAFEWETVAMAMGLLTVVLGGGIEFTEEDKKLLDELLPLLTAVSTCDGADPSLKEMADDLKVAVATRGVVWMEFSKIKSEGKHHEPKTEAKKEKPVPQSKKLIEVLSETASNEDNLLAPASDEVSSTHSIVNGMTLPDQISGSQMERAFQELCDPQVPVRGHGLISLAKMVEENNPEVKDKQEVLLKVFMENILHADSYIYLPAVNGLASLSNFYPDQVIPRLTSEFRLKCIQPAEGAKSGGEIVLKVGEAVVKATKRLGELTPKYCDHLLSAMLCGCRHGDALVRASSLSGLAEICKQLRFSVGFVLHEVLACCRDVMNSDPDPEPRKAATMTLTLLLQGLGKDSLLALSDVLINIYRVLKHTLSQDPDEKVRFHANLALGELDDIMRGALFAKPELKKTITILGYH